MASRPLAPAPRRSGGARSAAVRVEGTTRVYAIHPGEDLLEVLQSHGEPISTACGGVATCGTCRVVVVSGEEALVALRAREVEHLGAAARTTGLRLACQAQLRRDLDADADREVVVGVAPAPPVPP